METVIAAGESRYVVPGIGWQRYQNWLKFLEDQPMRITYDRGDLEVMTPLARHERHKARLRRMVHIVTEELDVPMMSVGSTTLNREDLEMGLEADDAFYLSNLPRITSEGYLNLKIDPAPDLAVEIEITPSAFNRLAIYGALGIGEIWRFDGETLRIHHRQQDGTYQEVEQSRVLPSLSIEEIRLFAAQQSSDDTSWANAFRRWVRETIVPQAQASDREGVGFPEA